MQEPACPNPFQLTRPPLLLLCDSYEKCPRSMWDAGIGWQTTELMKRRNAAMVLGCGGPGTNWPYEVYKPTLLQ